MGAQPFPVSFLWGVATSALQIEGGAKEDGRGESIWDRFAATPGRIADGSNPDVACDHYHRWREDILLMRWLGVGAYRFSIAWPRVFPRGRKPVNSAGLDFYDQLVDGLLESGIEPFVTLYHWDLPQTLQERGGWASRQTAEAFAEYASAIAVRLGDRVHHWTTHNEPWCAATLGYEQGVHAPGHTNPEEALIAAHHLLLSHAWALRETRRYAKGSEVGIVLSLSPGHPHTESDDDRDAVREFDGMFNRWYLDPIFRGTYPEDSVADRIRRGHLKDSSLSFVRAGDLQEISEPIDFLGVNYYSRVVLQKGPVGEPKPVQIVPQEERTDMDWEVYPQGLYEILCRIHRDYRPQKLYVTENGAAYSDSPDARGQIADKRRIDFLHSHLAAAQQVINEGVPLGGYFVWSLLDNFEWAQGYEKRFGLYWVDYKSQARLPKDSAYWYRDTVAANAIVTEANEVVTRRQS